MIGNFRGTLNDKGYTAPAGTTVTWWNQTEGSMPKVRKLNPAVAILNHRDLLGRYGENDQTLVGWQTFPAVSSEHSGGEAYGIVAKLFEVNKIGREPTEAEWVDFAFANFPDLLKVEIKDAQRVLPEYRADEGGGGGDAALRAELAALKQANSNLEARNNAMAATLGKQDAEIAALKARVRLVIPADIKLTLDQFPEWLEIKVPGGPRGKHARIRAALQWLRDEVARRG